MYAITLTQKDDRKVLYKFDNKDEAITKGNELIKTLTRDSGTLSCIQADFDDENNIINGRYRLIDTWL